MDWATVAELATALGTLVLAVATFASVRSSNRTAVLAERSLLASIRPLLVPSRLQDAEVKVGFADDHWMRLGGARAGADIGDDAVYLAIALRNAGAGLAVLNSWEFEDQRPTGSDVARPDPHAFRRLTRDLYLAPNDIGFWQGAIRDPADPDLDRVVRVVKDRQPFTIDILYSDADGGQRVISRFAVIPVGEEEWMAVVSRHWNIDRDDPR